MKKLPACVALALLLLGLGACAGVPGEGETADLSGAQPTRVTLRARIGVSGEGVRLSDGAVLPAGGVGDLSFAQAMVMSLRSPTAESLCSQGTFATLAEVPIDGAGCAAGAGGWRQIVYLDASTIHTLAESHAAGLGLLVRDRDHRETFRLRVVGDAYTVDDGASVVFESARVP